MAPPAEVWLVSLRVVTLHVEEDKIKEPHNPGLLLAICASPPTTSGIRTLNRLEMARKILRYEKLLIANMFPLPTRSSGELVTLGTQSEPWDLSRKSIESCLDQADGVLLAYGTSAPTGQARVHWKGQVSWLIGRLEGLKCPVWTVSDEPRHPSRWQRHTFREHPGMPFESALALSLRERVMPVERGVGVADGDTRTVGASP